MGRQPGSCRALRKTSGPDRYAKAFQLLQEGLTSAAARGGALEAAVLAFFFFGWVTPSLACFTLGASFHAARQNTSCLHMTEDVDSGSCIWGACRTG